MFFANNVHGERIHIDSAEPKGKYYCPACGALMIQKRGNINAHHFSHKSSTDFLIIFSNLRKCWKGLLYQAFPAFCVSEDTPHIMAFRSLIWHWKVVKP